MALLNWNIHQCITAYFVTHLVYAIVMLLYRSDSIDDSSRATHEWIEWIRFQKMWERLFCVCVFGKLLTTSRQRIALHHSRRPTLSLAVQFRSPVAEPRIAIRFYKNLRQFWGLLGRLVSIGWMLSFLTAGSNHFSSALGGSWQATTLEYHPGVRHCPVVGQQFTFQPRRNI